MKKQVITAMAIFIATVTLTAQSKNDIQHIKNVYYNTKEDITFSKDHKFEGRLYCDIVERNVNRKSWSGVGHYYSKIQYWYVEDPKHFAIDSSVDEVRTVLSMIIVNTEVAERKYYSEYLFDNGKLIFAYHKCQKEETRYYFKENKLIKKIGAEGEYILSEEESQQEAEMYIRTFLASVGEDDE